MVAAERAEVTAAATAYVGKAQADIEASRRRAAGKGKREVVDVELVDGPGAPLPGTAIAVRATDALVQRSPEAKARTLLAAFFAQRSALTVTNYRIDLVHFGRWWRAGGSDIDRNRRVKMDLDAVEPGTNDDARDVFVADVLVEYLAMPQAEGFTLTLAYQADLRSGILQPSREPYAVQTVNRRIAALRSVTDLARMLGLTALDLRGIKSDAPVRSRSTEGCGPEGVVDLMAQAERELKDAKKAKDDDAIFRAVRMILLVTLLHDSALRRFEPLQVRYPKGVDLRGTRLLFRRKKRPEAAWFPISDDVVEAIERYLAIRGRAEGYLIYGRDPSRPLNVATVNKLLAGLTERAQVQVTPHGLRHTSATTLLEETDGNVRAVAAHLGHADTRTVQVYDDERQKLPRQMSNLLGATRKALAKKMAKKASKKGKQRR